MGGVLALSNRVDVVLADITVFGGLALVLALVVYLVLRFRRRSEGGVSRLFDKVKGRYVWAALCAVTGLTKAWAALKTTTFVIPSAANGYQESKTSVSFRASNLTDAAVSLVVAWIIYWAGLAIYRAINRRAE